MRVFELAKQMGISSKELTPLLIQIGAGVTNHMSTVSEEHIQRILKLKKGAKGEGQRTTVAAPTPKVSPVAPLPPPAAEKKLRVLVKKKPEVIPSPPQETLEISGETSPLLPPVMDLPLPSLPVDMLAALSPAGAAGDAEALATKEGDKTAPSGSLAASLPVSPGVSPAVSPGEDAGKKAEKKKGGRDARKDDRSAPGRPTDKLKKQKPTRWDATIVEEAEADAPLISPEPTAAATENTVTVEVPVAPQETRKWQDFKPVHRKDRKGPLHRDQSGALSITHPRRKVIKLHEGLTVKEFSELVGQKVPVIIGKLMEMGLIVGINQPISLVEATLLAEEYGVKVESATMSEDEILKEGQDETSGPMLPRPPVITIMGHVDHGKTSLLDAIRKTRVTEGEAGGITQHIGAYRVSVGEKQVTFLDTPGHEAFTAMRSRGAKVTDLVVLVVAADDGVMPQTVEAINHAKAANVPVIVAINKIDKPDANPDRIRQALSEFDLVPEEWGGKTIYAQVSALRKTGLENLLEMILLQADVMELTASPDGPMSGTVIEAKVDRGWGGVATVLVQDGTLRVGDIFVSGAQYGKVRALLDDQGKKVQEAGPSTPVEVVGLNGIPNAGDPFVVVADESIAKEVASRRIDRQRATELAKGPRATLEDLYQERKDGKSKELTLVIKADVRGSAEAMKMSLNALATPAVKLNIIHTAIGGITESDVLLAAASRALVIGFNVRPESKARDLAERETVEIRLYTIIYNAISDVKAAMEGLLEPTLKERILGRIEVRQTFNVSKIGTIAGGYVTEGTVARNSTGARVIRDQVVVYQGKVSSLRRFKDDVKEVLVGYECGVGIENFSDIKIGDFIEVYTIDKIATRL